MKNNKIIIMSLFCLSIVFKQQASTELAVASWDQESWAGWVTNTAPSDTGLTPDVKKLISKADKHVGMVVAEAIGILQRGTRAGAATNKIPFYLDPAGGGSILTTAWLGQFATLLSSGVPPYQNMKRFNLSTVLSPASLEYSYLINHLVPALNGLNAAVNSSVDTTHFATALNFTPGSFNGAIVTTIQNNTQMTFDMYQGSNQIGVLSPGVNSVALYGAAQAQGDIVFVPTTGNDGGFRISFKTGPEVVAIANATAVANGTTPPYSVQYPPADAGAGSEFMCVQITAADFPAQTTQQVQQMMQRTECINLSQMTCPVNITLKIEDSMTVMNQGVPTVIGQEMIPMYYPSISNIVFMRGQVVPFLVLPEKLALQPVLSCWVSFINMVMGTLLTNYATLFTSDYISWFIAQQMVIFLLKQSNNDFGNITNILRAKDFIGNAVYFLPQANVLSTQIVSSIPVAATSSSYDTSSQTIFSFMHNALQNNAVTQQINAKGEIVTLPAAQPRQISYAFAGLPGTQYLFTGDIPSLEDFELYLHLNSSLAGVYDKAIVSLDSSITLTNLLPLLQKNVVPLWTSMIKYLGIDLRVKFVSMLNGEAFFEFVDAQPFAQKIVPFLTNNSLLMQILSTATDIVSFKYHDASHASFVMKDVIAYLQSAISVAASKKYMPLVGGAWNFIQNRYGGPSVVRQLNNEQQYVVHLGDGFSANNLINDLQKNPTWLPALLSQEQIQLRDQGGNMVTFSALSVLQFLCNQKGFVIKNGNIKRMQKSSQDKGLKFILPIRPEVAKN